MKTLKKYKNLIINTLLLIALLGGTYAGQQYLQTANEIVQPKSVQVEPKSVEVQFIKKKEIELWRQYSSNTVAIHNVEIRPQVSGLITEVLFEDGDFVKEGQTLFKIDSRPFDAIAEREKADIISLENDISYKKKELDRAEVLVQKKAISQRLYDERLSSYNVSLANLEAAKARLSQAEINLAYTSIKSPVDGRASRAEITKGNLVESGVGAPVLTRVVSAGPIYADFNIDEQTFLKYLKPFSTNRRSQYIKVVFENELGNVAVEGQIHNFDNAINTSSGTIRARAYFQNDDNSLIPGMFGTVKILIPEKNEAILISEKAIGTNQDKKFVYVVNSENKVEYREVNLQERVDGQRLVSKGLLEGDIVIVDSLMHIRPDMPVRHNLIRTAQ